MVVYSETYDGLDFALYQFVEYAVVVALVLAADYPYYGFGLALERVPCRIYIRCLGIIDVQYPAYAQYRFETVLDREKLLRLLRIISSLIPVAFAARAAAIELYMLCFLPRASS